MSSCVTPSASAILRLITRVNRVGWSIGRSACRTGDPCLRDSSATIRARVA